MNFMTEVKNLEFYNTESETMRFVMHEFDDTLSMLKDVMLRFKREGKNGERSTFPSSLEND